MVDDLMIFRGAIDSSRISQIYHERGWNTPSPGLVPLVAPVGPMTICRGASATLTAPSGFDSYLWSTGATTSTITVEETGTYSVALSNKGSACPIRSQPVTVEVLPTPKPTVIGPNAVCDNDTILLSVAEEFPWYAWSTGDTSCTIAVTGTGKYAVMVMSEAGCLGTSSMEVVRREYGSTARIGVEQELHFRRDAPAVIPITLDAPLDDDAIDKLIIYLSYNEAVVKVVDITAGTLLDGWTIRLSLLEPGVYRIEATSPIGSYLKGKGTLLNLNAHTKREGPTEGNLDITVAGRSAGCTDLAGVGGRVILDLSSGITETTKSETKLNEAYPNPFTGATDIGFTLAETAHVTLSVHDNNGNSIARLLDDEMEAGAHSIRWTPNDLPSGLYFIRMTAGSRTLAGTLIYIK